MVHPQPPDDQRLTDPAFQELERGQVRREADLAMLRALRCNLAQGATRRHAIERVNEATAVLHRDLEIYRKRLVREIGEQPPARHLRMVPTTAAVTAAALGYRTETS